MATHEEHDPAEATQAGSLASASPNGASQVPSPLRILIVDDLVDAADSLALLLKRRGHSVRTVYDGSAALSAAESFIPQVVVLDLAMPKLDGYCLAERLRQQPGMQRACLIALSGYGRATDVEKSRQAGCDHHLLKPAGLAQLEAILSKLVGRESIG